MKGCLCFSIFSDVIFALNEYTFMFETLKRPLRLNQCYLVKIWGGIFLEQRCLSGRAGAIEL